MGASSLLDVPVSTELIAETLIKPTQKSPKTLSLDVIKCLGIVTKKQGQADATLQIIFTAYCFIKYCYIAIFGIINITVVKRESVQKTSYEMQRLGPLGDLEV